MQRSKRAVQLQLMFISNMGLVAKMGFQCLRVLVQDRLISANCTSETADLSAVFHTQRSLEFKQSNAENNRPVRGNPEGGNALLIR